MRLRYLAPNLITASSLVFGLVSLSAAHRGDWRLAGWMIIYAVMTDRLDGLVARRLKATSQLGVQLDSFADFLNFGLAPAFLMYAFLRSPAMVAGPLDLPYDHGWARAYLATACVIWVLAAVFRLARFNVAAEDGVPTRIYFGVPTTLAGGLLVIWFLALLKYAQPGDTFGGPKLLGEQVVTPRAVWLAIPALMMVGAYLMASSLRMLKVGTAESKAITVFLIVNILSGYLLGFAQLMPEYLVWMPSAWIVVFLVWGALAEEARDLRPPPLFPAE
ncbi:MAG: CDP-alcohol phosphatidyltransferase family protein [Kofleriaceae bacterium]|jgi:CDP-diacylglycerol--serine O-phosphatidyltransferase|nr:CDP-alcohol phosphatidyltransferase family protein [Kofleriaceae bacterium]MBP9169470.1 CDP-alcohol phosphatidyltransferase family protein [Kofleriaceae bacterium]MBP9861836.1 CDP-alcohol phosphatidyltransferase family protein [Kofleriaceae bacterium]